MNRKSYPERVRSALFHAINVEFTKNLGEIHRSRGEFYAPKPVNRSFEPALGLQIRTLHLKILQDTYRHIAKAVLYCMEN